MKCKSLYNRSEPVYQPLCVKIMEESENKRSLDLNSVDSQAEIMKKIKAPPGTEAYVLEIFEKLREKDAQMEMVVREKIAQLEMVVREKDAQSARVITDRNLRLLASSGFNMIPIEKLVLPEMTNSISAECEKEVADIVKNFNEQLKNIIEKSGSIGEPNSVHHFWNLIFTCIQKHHGAMRRRLAYEWYIRNICTDEDNSIDFTFIPFTDKFLN